MLDNFDLVVAKIILCSFSAFVSRVIVDHISVRFYLVVVKVILWSFSPLLACTPKTDGCRVQGIEIWGLGVLVEYVQVTFDLVVVISSSV